MKKTIYIRRNYYYHGEQYGVSTLFKFSKIDDMTLYVTVQHDCLWLHVLVVMAIMGMCCSKVMDKLSEELTCFLWLFFVEFWSFHMVMFW